LTIEGRPPSSLLDDALFRLVSAGYLETLGARLKEGRFLTEADREGSLPVVVVNEALVRRYWPDQSPLGHRIDSGTGGGQSLMMTIVGVVGDIRESGLDLAMKPAVYVPFAQTGITFFEPSEIAVRTSRRPLSLANELQAAVWSVDPEQPVTGMQTGEEIVDGELSNRQQVLNLLGALASLALVLAALGLYGVLSYLVSQRTREIGLRMAIGADAWDVSRAILTYSVRLTLSGLLAGVLGATVATRLLSTLLYGVSPLDWRTFLSVSALLLAVAMLASYIPARRAASIDPAIALREES
jgi:putative ABC transport system permease protein